MSSKADDPRDAIKETRETLPHVWYRESTGDVLNTSGMFLSGLIVVTRNKYMAWGAVMFAFSAFINSHPLRLKEGGTYGWSTLLLCVSAFFAAYFPLFVVTK